MQSVSQVARLRNGDEREPPLPFVEPATAPAAPVMRPGMAPLSRAQLQHLLRLSYGREDTLTRQRDNLYKSRVHGGLDKRVDKLAAITDEIRTVRQRRLALIACF